jgi:UDP-GlcNAc:undecaprenyl-phosphate GlcNAc-1-phosphate transferase
MMIGLILGVIALRSTVKEATSVAFAPLLAIWAILILDSAAAVVRRTMTGRSIYCTDRGHIHHRFISKGFSHGQISLCIGGLCAFTSCGAVTSVLRNSEFTGLIVAIVAVLALAVTRVFGHVEFSLLGKHLARVGRNRLRLKGAPQATHNSLAIQLQGNHHWNELWTAFLESTDRYGLVHLRLNLHLPRYQEDFFAHWTTRDAYENDMTWSLERPLMFDDTCIGRLAVRGRHITSLPGAANVSVDFLECLETLEEQLQQVVGGLYSDRESQLVKHAGHQPPEAASAFAD